MRAIRFVSLAGVATVLVAFTGCAKAPEEAGPPTGPPVCSAVGELASAYAELQSVDSADAGSRTRWDQAVAEVRDGAPADIGEALGDLVNGEGDRGELELTVTQWARDTCGVNPFVIPRDDPPTDPQPVAGVLDWFDILEMVKSQKPEATWPNAAMTAIVASDDVDGVSVVASWNEEEDRVVEICEDIRTVLVGEASGQPVRVRVDGTAIGLSAISTADGTCVLDEDPPADEEPSD